MLAPTTCQENFHHSIALEQLIGARFGYQLSNSHYLQILQSLPMRLRGGLVINPHLHPRQPQQTTKWHNLRLDEIAKEMQWARLQRELEEKEASGGSGFDAQKVISQKIREHNDLVEHKNLDGRRAVNGQAGCADQQGKVVEEIKSKLLGLSRAKRLDEKVQCNKQISKVYKQYSQSMSLPKNQKLQPKMPANKQPNKAYSLALQPRVKRKIHSHRSIKPEIIDQDMLDRPYASDRFMQRSTQLSQEIKRSRHLLELIKHRVNMASQNSGTKESLIKDEVQTEQNPLNENIFLSQPSRYDDQYSKMSGRNIKHPQRFTQKQKQLFLSTLLRKRNPRYLRQEGSKVLTRFNSHSLAKQMVQGPERAKKVRLPPPIPKMRKRKPNFPLDLTADDRMAVDMILENEEDSYYWSMCRNEKINLLMKSHRHPLP